MLEPSQRGQSKQHEGDDRLTELKRMRAIATLLLLTMTALFLTTTMAKADQPWIPYLQAFAEAAMVGACADWFAVVALFRRPFGLPIPHTGIIPANQSRIGAALGRFVTNNFLSREATSRKLIEMDIVGSLGRWLANPVNARRIAYYGGRLLPEILHNLPRDRLSEFVGTMSRRGVEAVPAALLASRVIETLWAQGQTQTLLDSAIEHTRNWLLHNKDFIRRKVGEKSSRWIPKFVDSMLADRIMSGLLATMDELRNPNHPWRVELHQAVEKLVVDLASDPTMKARGEEMKRELLTNPMFIAQAEFMWMKIEEGLYADLPRQAEAIAAMIEVALLGLAKWLTEEPALPALANRRIRLIFLRVLFRRRSDIGRYIARVVENWDSSTLVSKLELQVGKDLQYVRINGTLVGGLVGLCIFVLTKWLPTF
jgi:uncharacterized membrane-anchored protein YjiN (DUF445 family)